MNIKELREKNKVIDLFAELCEIPSPSLKEDVIAERIISIFKKNNISAEYDNYKNVIARIPATTQYEHLPPLLLSAHMDVVGGSEEVIIRLSEDKNFIETDKTRTLGADDKAGVAAIMDLAIDLADPDNKIEHGALEIIFTRDEERGMTGIRNLDTSALESKYAIIADGERLGELDTEGAGFTNVFVEIYGGKGGHSGINIHEKDRINAIKVLSELDSAIPQGVYKFIPKKGVITSINAGVCLGETANISISEMIKDAYKLGKENKVISQEYSSADIIDTVIKSSALNVITSKAKIAYSIRSSEPDNEKELVNLIKKHVDKLNRKYQNMIKIKLEVKPHLKPFVKNEDDFLSQIIIESAKAHNIKCFPSSFHAGAETHILANEKKNSYNQSFNPVIIGIANLENIHSSDEKIDWKSFLAGRKWLEEIVIKFAKKQINLK